MFLVGRSVLLLLALLLALLAIPGFAQLLDDDPGAEAENASSSGTALPPSLGNSHWALTSDMQPTMQASHPTSGHSNGSSSGGDGGSDAPGPGGGGAPGQFFCPPIIDCSALLQRGLLLLNEGSVIELDRLAGEPLDILVNGAIIAKGEVVMVGERYGVRFTDIVDPEERVESV